MFTKDLQQRMMAAHLRDASPEEMKRLFMEQNTFGLDPDTPIYRIFELQYFVEDVSRTLLTHVLVDPDVWHEPGENPLLKKKFRDENGDIITLRNLVRGFFALSWTTEPSERTDYWENFSRGRYAIRVRTTVDKLLNGVMAVENEYCGLTHYIGRVTYHDEARIKQWLASAQYIDFLDSLGHQLALSVMILRSKYSDECEARLLFSLQRSKDSRWVAANVVVEGVPPVCRIPFQWKPVAEEVILKPSTPSKQEEQVRELVATYLNCDVRRSSLES